MYNICTLFMIISLRPQAHMYVIHIRLIFVMLTSHNSDHFEESKNRRLSDFFNNSSVILIKSEWTKNFKVYPKR